MKATTLSEIARDGGWSPVRKTLDAQAFGVNGWTKNAGEELVGRHTEERTGQEELYVVVAGRATVTVDDEERDAPAGTVVLVAPESYRSLVAEEDGTTVLVVGAKPGEYRPPAFELNGFVIELFAEGKIEEARDLLQSVPAGTYADHAPLDYNLACCEARLGNVDGALAHLERSVAGRPNLANLARDDDDLASLRDDPRFAELVATPG